jgi:superfamily II DNA or RNA helicase
MSVKVEYDASIATIKGLKAIDIEGIKKVTYLPELEDEIFESIHDKLPITKSLTGIKYLFEQSQGNVIIPTGLLPRIYKSLKVRGVKLELVAKGTNDIKINNYELSEYLDNRSYQKDVIPKMLSCRRGIVKAPTGSGKTIMMSEVIRILPKDIPILYMVPSKLLLYQAKSDIENYLSKHDCWEEVGLIGDGCWDLRRINVAIPNTLYNQLKKGDKGTLVLLDSIKALFVDECGEICCNPTGWNVIQAMRNREYSIGVSATPWSNNGLSLLIEGCHGQLLVDIDEKELINEGYITKPYIKFYEIPYCKKLSTNLIRRFENASVRSKRFLYSKLYKICISNNPVRNNILTDKISDLIDISKGPIAIIVENVGTTSKSKEPSHSERLQSLLAAKGYEVPIIHGKTGIKKKREVLSNLKEGSIPAIIAGPKTITSGIDLPTLAGVVICGAGKADNTLIQRIGRALRISNDKDKSYIVDFYDTTLFFERQAYKRLAICEEIYGEDTVEVIGYD